jgi:hypothetical protein
LPDETADSIKSKLKRGTFAATFFLACLAAMEIEGGGAGRDLVGVFCLLFVQLQNQLLNFVGIKTPNELSVEVKRESPELIFKLVIRQALVVIWVWIEFSIKQEAPF